MDRGVPTGDRCEHEPAPSEVAQAHNAVGQSTGPAQYGATRAGVKGAAAGTVGPPGHPLRAPVRGMHATSHARSTRALVCAECTHAWPRAATRHVCAECTVPGATVNRQVASCGVTDDRPAGKGRTVSALETIRANRADWDRNADDYQAEHGEFLRDVGFVWSPEGLDEAAVRLLGDVRGRRVLEVGCGAAQCARWLCSQGASVVGVDLSLRQLQHSRRIDDATALSVPVVCATATQVPLADDTFDLACSAFGALPFVADIGVVMAEVARVLRPGGRWVFAVAHPLRWIFPDDPTEHGLTVVRPYFDHTPYVEQDEEGRPSYVEHHHTLGEWVRAVVGAGFVVEDLVEPEWPAGHHRVWGAWGPYRGRFIPGTAIFVCALP